MSRGDGDLERERLLREMLETAIELPTGERRPALAAMSDDAALVDEVLSLVAGEEGLGGFLALPAADRLDTPALSGRGPATGGVRPRDTPPEIPGFVVLQPLGHGGMGSVFLARQTEPVVRLVAIKVVRAMLTDAETAERFTAERHALARLNHPSVAQLYEAGVTADGRPFVAMEHVDGLPITTYCDRERLPVEERLRLFVAVCRGVEHAHTKQLLHRDLKPSNVLVTTVDGVPTPKIIDFGIARALDSPPGEDPMITGPRLLGTPAYMSPEALDADGPRDLDTRADVYSLGVLLYELLAGSRPFGSSSGDIASIVRALSGDDAARPSTRVRKLDDDTAPQVAAARRSDPRQLSRRLDGDLDWISLKALARDREQRYGSAAALAEDVERSLAHKPVSARPPSLADRVTKLVRRHRLAAALVSITAVVVVAAVVLVAFALVRTRQAERTARDEAVATGEVLGFLVGLFEGASPSEARGEEVTARELVERGVESLDEEGLAPLQRARLLHTLADVQLRLGDYQSGRALAERALDLRRDELGPEHPDRLATLELLSTFERRVGDLDAAEPRVEHLLAVAERHGEPAEIADALNSLANLRWRQERLEEAEALHRRALDLRREIQRQDPTSDHAIDVGGSLNNLGVLLWGQKRPEEAEPYLREAAELFENELGADHPRVSAALGNIGIVLHDLGRHEENEELQRRVLTIRQRVLGPDHPDLAVSLNNYAIALSRAGKTAEAEAVYRRCLEILHDHFGDEHVESLRTAANLGNLLRREGRHEEAEEILRRVLEARARSRGEGDPLTARSRLMLGQTLAAQGRREEAEALLTRALADLVAGYGEASTHVETAREELAKLRAGG